MASAFDSPLAPPRCDHCGNATEGTIVCSVKDSKNLCQYCFEGLPNAKREEIGEQEWVCDIHFDQKVKIFCETCQVGCCKECAGDIHKGHKVVNAFELEQEIRRNLKGQLKEVGERAAKLPLLRQMIDSSKVKIEEAPKSVDKVVNDIKEEITRHLQEEVHRINWETQHSIFLLEMRRNDLLGCAKEKARLDIQRIEEIKQDFNADLRKDMESKKRMIEMAETKLMVCQQACESANTEVKSLLESTPEKLVSQGRQLNSLVKASSAFQCESDVVGSCREADADLPKVKVRKDNFFISPRPFPPLVKYMLCILVILYFASKARGPFLAVYNCLLSSESVPPMFFVINTLVCFPFFYAKKCCILLMLFQGSNMLDYPFARKVSYMQILKIFLEIPRIVSEFEIYTILFVILVNSPLYFFQLKSVGANFVSFISVLQSCSFIYYLQISKKRNDIALKPFFLKLLLK